MPDSSARWPPTSNNIPPPRRSHDSRPSSPLTTPDDSRRRSSSDGATPKQGKTLFHIETQGLLSRSVRSKQNAPGSSPSITTAGSNTSATGSSASSILYTNVPFRSQSRADNFPSREATSSPIPNTARASPQKAQRTYDNKLISREFDRLGMQFQSGSSSTLVSTASASTLSLAPTIIPITESRSTPLLGSTSTLSIPSSSQDSPWTSLHLQVLPLFNGEPLHAPIEDLNQLVRQHIQIVLSRGPSKAIATLEADLVELISTGMMNLNAKLTGIDDDKLVTRLIEVWNFFWVQVLPYVEGVFLPLQTDSLLLSVGRTSKGHRRGSSSSGLDLSSSNESRLDVRHLALLSFRDAIILPRFEKLRDRLSESMKDGYDVGIGKSEDYQQPRLQQMLLVLGSNSHSSSSDSPSPGEQATRYLLRVVRRATTSPSPFPHNRPSVGSNFSLRGRSSGPLMSNRGGFGAMASFAGAPGDRRGRINLDSAPSFRTRSSSDLQHSSTGTPSTIVPSSASRIWREQQKRKGAFLTDEELEDDDDNSDLGMPLGSTTPTLTSGAAGGVPLGVATGNGRPPFENGVPWARDRERAFLDTLKSPIVQEGFKANPSQATASNSTTRVQHDYETDEEEDYGQPVTR